MLNATIIKPATDEGIAFGNMTFSHEETGPLLTATQAADREIQKRSSQLGYGLGAALRQHVLGPKNTEVTANSDLSSYTTWRKKLVNWLLSETPLQEAIVRRDITALRHFTSNKLTLNKLNFMGYAAVHRAVLEDWPEGLTVLHEAGADLLLKDRSGLDPVFLAIANKKHAALNALTQSGINAQNKCIVKMEASEYAHISGIKSYLGSRRIEKLEEGKIIHEMELFPHTFALLLSDVQSFSLLPPPRQMPEDSNDIEVIQSCTYPLFSACYYTTDPQVFNYFVENDENVNQTIRIQRNGGSVSITPLVAAIDAGNVFAFRQLLLLGANLFSPLRINDMDTTPFHYLVGPQYTARNRPLQEIALQFLPPSRVNEYFQIGPESDYQETPLIMAIALNKPDIVQHVLDLGGDPFAIMTDGIQYTPFQLGVWTGGEIQRRFIVDLARRSNQTFNINELMGDVRRERVSPLAYTILARNYDSTLLLIRMGADPYQPVLPGRDLFQNYPLSLHPTTPMALIREQNPQLIEQMIQIETERESNLLIFSESFEEAQMEAEMPDLIPQRTNRIR